MTRSGMPHRLGDDPPHVEEDGHAADPGRRWLRAFRRRSGRSGLPLWTRFAVGVGGLASWLSQAMHLGSGAMIGGRLMLALDPRALKRLCQGRLTVLITGTNGKTTTTAMIAAALRELGDVASNETGANMPGGLVAALAENRTAEIAVLEVDEGYFPSVATAIRPAAAVLLNLSRDQIDRVAEVGRTERAIRGALDGLNGTTAIVNCDDALMSSAAHDATRSVWVSVGSSWQENGACCPRCGRALLTDGNAADAHWRCECGLSRSRPQWILEDGGVVPPGGERVPLRLGLPGRANARNAAMAVAAAVSLGVPLDSAVSQVSSLTEVAGRYRTVDHNGHQVRLLLAKNPAGWAEMLDLLAATRNPVVIAINAREADGRDTSWLWDVPFELLRGRSVVASGERATDLAVRLTYADVPHVRLPDPWWAVDVLRPGHVDLVANYTAFRDLSR
jgi:UDP-N-acetylmuramyl tripeptide synthase